MKKKLRHGHLMCTLLSHSLLLSIISISELVINFESLQERSLLLEAMTVTNVKCGYRKQILFTSKTMNVVMASYSLRVSLFSYLPFTCTRALQPVATCHQSSYLHKPAIVIVTSLSLWRHSRGAVSQPASQLFSLWRHYHCDVRAGHAERYGRTYVTYVRTPYHA